MRILHIADVHWRGLSRHEEYIKTFQNLFEHARELQPDVIYVGGDIVHSKTQGISPELIDALIWWFNGMAKIAPTHVILGNHDGLILNKDRQDAITPIITALNNDRIFLYKDSGTYPIGIPGFNWCVFSCFDEDGWKDVKPIEGEVNIALFHGAVRGSKTDVDWHIEGEVESSFFEGFDFALLGDIHKVQYLNDKKTIAYCGSTIQQNYGEDPGKGFLFWDIKSKDEFTSKFYSVEHDQPFVTVDWKGAVNETMHEAKKHLSGARFRIRSDTQINQTDIVHLHAELKHEMKATEIVYKYDVDFGELPITSGEDEFNLQDLRSEKTLQKLMKDYYKDASLSDEELQKINDLISTHLGSVSQYDATARNTKWSIKEMKFDNMFSYGKNNVINFNTLGGITGIFGRNRSGKSSIIGTIMYTLFNTTDRGPIKNVHIINSRKGHCKASMMLSINGSNVVIERQSVKHQNRQGKVNATTQLNFYRADADGNMIQDLTEEQRRETEKVIRKLIGTADDFLLTSLASQGAMNTFIRERATARKMILTKFLDLDVFEKMLDSAKDDANTLKGQLKNVPDRDWDVAIYELSTTLKNNRNRINKVERILAGKRSKCQDVKLELARLDDSDVVTQIDVDAQKQVINQLSEQLIKNNDDKEVIKQDIAETSKRLKKIRNFKDMFPIEELNTRLDEQRNLETSLLQIQANQERAQLTLDNQLASVSRLLDVPCGDDFPTCKFIKNSHRDKTLLGEQKNTVTELLEQITVCQNSLKALKTEKLEEKVKKYNTVLQQEADLKVELSKKRSTKMQNTSERDAIQEKLTNAKDDLCDLEDRVIDVAIDEKILALKTRVNNFSNEIMQLDAKRISLAENIGKIESELVLLKKEKSKFLMLKQDMKVYDLFSSAVSKKGIPLQIIRSQLPSINSEIAKILQGVVGFTVELEADKNSNAMDIYINYGDSRRIIECASGMEKMMASLAIRVALINVSSLPKTDMLIIDEGFGALDEMNVEACNRLLDSLKRWFRNILVISHVDAVKDVVDNVIDITHKEKNARVYVV